MSAMFRRASFIAVAVLSCSCAVFAQQSLTFNEVDDFIPVFSGKYVAWLQRDAGGLDQVILYDGKTARAITEDLSVKQSLVAGGKWLAWISRASGYYDVMLWDGRTVRLLSRSVERQDNPHTDGKWVVWEHDVDGADSDIFLWDGKETRAILLNVFDDLAPKVSGGRVVWYSTNNNEVYLYDGKKYVPGVDNGVVLLDDSAVSKQNPCIEGGLIAWRGQDAGVWGIYLHDGVATTKISTSAATAVSGMPRISRKCIVWTAVGNGGNQDVFLWDKGVVTQVTNTPADEAMPVNYGRKVAWVVDDGNDYEVMYFNGKDLTAQLSNNATIDHGQQINGKAVVWMTFDGVDMEINLYPGKLKLP
jgi:hypothetical protein